MRELILASALVATMGVVVICGTFGCGPEAEAQGNEGGTEQAGAQQSAAQQASPGAAPTLPPPDVTPEEWAAWVENGTKLFNTTCVACHGPNAVGMPGLGKPLANSPFVQSLDDEALLAFVQKGRDPSDPANTTGIGMPAKGGNPALSEDDILDIISYLRTLQGG